MSLQSVSIANGHRREHEKAISRYDEWTRLREEAIKNHEASGSTEPLPKSLTDTPPPRPEPYEEEQMTDVSIDMTANGFDASESFTLDRSIADDVVPMADPGIDRAQVCAPPATDYAAITDITTAYFACGSRSQHPKSTERFTFYDCTSYAKKVGPPD